MPQSPPITISYAKEQLAQWMSALEACSTGANYTIAGRSLTRQDVESVIMPQVTRFHRMLASLEQAAEGTVRPMGSVASFTAPGGSGGSGIIPGVVWRSGQT